LGSRLILLLEDEELIMLDLEARLINAGFAVGMARSCEEAVGFLAAKRPDAAILDVRLKDGECVEIAGKLIEQDVPLVVHSGADSEGLPPVFAAGRYVPKPSNPDNVADILLTMLANP